MKIAFFTPLNPLPLGISDYSEDLLPTLKNHADLDLYIENYQPSNPLIVDNFNILEFKAEDWIKQSKKYAAIIYQMGNNRFHYYIWKALQLVPGIVVLHDYILHHGIVESTLLENNFKEYKNELAYVFGLDATKIAHRITNSSDPIYQQCFKYPLNSKALDFSQGVLVHSEFVLNLVKEASPSCPVEKVPMGVPLPAVLPLYEIPDEKENLRALRKKLKIPKNAFVIGIFGKLGANKRLEVCFKTFATFNKQLTKNEIQKKPVFLLLVGRTDPTYPLKPMIQDLGISEFTILVESPPLEEFQKLIGITDLCLNLRYPTAFETSAPLLRLMAVGKPVVVSEYAQFMEFPEPTCFKVPLGNSEEEILFKTLKNAYVKPENLQKIGRNAQEFIKNNHTLEISAQKYIESIKNFEKENKNAKSYFPLNLDLAIDKLLDIGVDENQTSLVLETLYTLKGRDEGKANFSGEKLLSKTFTPKVFIIVLTWNGKQHLEECLPSLLNQTYQNCSIVVVDNGSIDGSQKFIKENYSSLTLLENKTNIGFAAGNNVGIQYALDHKADYVVILNNDTVVESNWIEILVNYAEADPTIGLLGSKMLVYDHKEIINSLGHTMNRLGLTYDIGFGRYDDKNPNSPISELQQPREVVSICGGGMFLSSEALLSLDYYFDESFFIYYEDVDLSIRIWGNGFKVLTIPEAVIYHKFTASTLTSKKIYLCELNKFRVILKLFPKKILFTTLLGLYRREFKHLLGKFRIRDWLYFFALLKANTIIFLTLPKILWKRWQVQSKMIAPDYFLSLLEDSLEVPEFFNFKLDYQIFQHPFQKDKDQKDPYLPDRILMGINDKILGFGWYPLEGEQIRFRWMAKKAICFFNPIQDKKTTFILQIHLCCPYALLKIPNLKIFVNDRLIGERNILTFQGQWITLHFPMESKILVKEKQKFVKIVLEVDEVIPAELTGELKDVSIQINEIAILASDSPFLRKPIFEEKAYPFGANLLLEIKTSLQPNIMKAQIESLKYKKEILAEFEKEKVLQIPLKIKNLGDTAWIASVLPNGGYVTVGAKLFDLDGNLISESLPRYNLPYNILPEHEFEIIYHFKTPPKPGEFCLRIDLINEKQAWFEAYGSMKPLDFMVKVK